MIGGGFAWILAMGLLPLLGAPMISRRPFRRLSIPCRVVLAGGAGAVVLSTAMTAVALLGLRWRLWELFLATGSLSWLLGALAARGAAPPSARTGVPEEPSSVSVWLSRVLILVAVGCSFVVAATSAATSADLVLVWGLKGQRFATAGTFDAGLLGNPFLSHVTAAYPPLVPNVYAFASLLAGRFSWGAATLTFPMLVLAIALALPSALEGRRRPRQTLPAVAILIAVVGATGRPLLIAGNADMPLIFFEVLSLAILVSPARSERPFQILAGVLIAGAATAKVEGLIFAVASICLILFVNRGRPPRIATAARISVPTILALGAWFGFGFRSGLFHGYRGFGPLLEIHWNRLGLVLTAVARQLFAVDYALPFVLPVLLLFIVRPARAGGWIPAATSFAGALFLVFNYLHGAADPTEWIGWSAGRVLLTGPVLAVLSMASREVDRETAEAHAPENTIPPDIRAPEASS